MNNSILQQLPKLPDSWRFTPVNSKKQPIVSKWQETPLTAQDIIDKYQFNPNVQAVGLLTGELSGGIVAVDHDGDSCDPLIEKLSSLSLDDALPKTVGFTSGKQGRYQLLYKVPDLFWPYIDNQKIDTKVKDLNGKDEQLDFRWNGHQSVILGVHPETGSYQWLPNQSPSDIEVADCPLWIIREIISFRSFKNLDSTNTDKAIECLGRIKNKDLEWHEWRNILLALHYEGVEREIAYVWSSTSDKHLDKGFNDVWEHIRDNKPDGQIITLGTLIHLAKEINPSFKPSWVGVNQNATPKQKDDGLLEIKEDLADLIQHSQRVEPLLCDNIHNPLVNLAKNLDVPIEAFEMATLTVCGSQMPSGLNLLLSRSTNYKARPILFTALSGDSGTSKSTIMSAIWKPLDELQGLREMEHDQSLAEYDADYRAWKKDSEKQNGEPPKEPIPTDFYVKSFTIESLSESLHNNKLNNQNNGLLVAVSELKQFLDGMTAYKTAGSTDRPQWLGLYDGDSLKVNRKTGIKRIYIPNPSVSILGTIQPETFKAILKDDKTADDGFWPRFAFVNIPIGIPKGIDDGPNYDLGDLLKFTYQACRALNDQTLTLSPKAKHLWNEWHYEIAHLVRDEGNSQIRAIYPKAKERAARLALIANRVNSIFYDSFTHVISVDELERAIAYSKYLIDEAKQLYGSIGLTLDESPTQILNFVKRFQNQDWLNTRRVRDWMPRPKPSFSDTRSFMAKVVQLRYAEDNSKPIDSSGYQIKIISEKERHNVTKNPKPFNSEGLTCDVTNVTRTSLNVTDNSQNGHSDNGKNEKSIVSASDVYKKSMINKKTIDNNATSQALNNVNSLNGHHKHNEFVSSSDVLVTLSDVSNVTEETFTYQDLQPISDVVTLDSEKNNSKILDIYKLDTTPLPDWKPKKTLKPYKDLSIIHLDIETTGLDSTKNRVIFIGCKQNGQYHIFTNQSEAQILTDFSNWFNKSGSDVLSTFNGYRFDIPFLIERFKVNGLQNACPFQQASLDDKWSKKIVDKAQENGKPFEFLNVTCKNRSISIIDNYLLVLLWDYVAMKLTSHTLKQSVLQIGLREEQRLELSHNQIMDAWNNGDSDRLVEYLKYDLDDTELLTNKLLPSYYYQLALLDGVSLQGVTIMGQAGKWSIILGQHYGKSYKNSLTADEPIKFEGGSVLVNAGLYKNAAKIDVASLYPSIMLNYGITSRKDKDRFQLQVLKYLTSERLQLKALGKQGDTEASHFAEAMKVLINSGYGFLTTANVPFNDYESGSKIPAYGRLILDKMLKTIHELNATVIEADTDGVIFSSDDPKAVYEAVQSVLPSGINIELEWSNKSVYVPKAKSYIIFSEDGKVTLKGTFRKRDSNWINTGFPVEYLKYYLESPDQAYDYFLKIFDEIRERKIDIEKLQVTKRIPKNNKSMAHLGSLGDKVTYWIAEQPKYHKVTGSKLKSAFIPTNNQPYSVDYYLGEIEDIRQEINQVIER